MLRKLKHNEIPQTSDTHGIARPRPNYVNYIGRIFIGYKTLSLVFTSILFLIKCKQSSVKNDNCMRGVGVYLYIWEGDEFMRLVILINVGTK